MTKQERIIEAMHNSANVDKVNTWNAYMEEIRGEDWIYSMSEFDDVFYNASPLDLVSSLNRSFCACDDWFCETIWGIESADDPEDWMCLEDLANEAVDGNHDFDNSEIREILNER